MSSMLPKHAYLDANGTVVQVISGAVDGAAHDALLADYGVPPERLRMLRSFDPRSGAHALDVEDPYYGDHTDFEDVFTVIEVALPGLHLWVDAQLAGRDAANRGVSH